MATPPTGDHERLHRLVYRLTAGFLFAAAVLRSVLIYDGRDLSAVLAALAVWLLLLLLEGWLGGAGGPEAGEVRRRASWFAGYVALQCGLIALLLYAGGDSGDFFAILFAILGMQVVGRYRVRVAVVVLGLFVPVMFIPLAVSYDPAQALVFTMIYSAATALMAAYSVASRKAVEATAANERLAAELRVANRGIEAYSTHVGRLAAARERHRLAHDLHDSVTQTIFSMTLTTQSAALLLDRDPPRVAAQLDRLAQLTRGALAEMQLLISELTPDRRLEGGLVANLERHLAERAAPHGVDVAVEVTGDGILSPHEEQNLLRIAQEAVNNIVKHADADAATVRLTLARPCRLEIEDRGRGFDADALRTAEAGSGLGFGSMRERAAEIGWSFEVRSRPGGGTLVIVEAGAGFGEAGKGASRDG